MTTGGKVWIALLRAIGPATHKIMPMSKLRQALQDAGLGEVKTVLATGNLIFSSPMDEPEVHKLIGRTVRSFGLQNEVFLRGPADLNRLAASNPFADACMARPGKLLVLFFERDVGNDAASLLRKRASSERIEQAGREVFIDYVGAIAASKLTSGAIERITGASATARNWNSVMRLKAVAEQHVKDR